MSRIMVSPKFNHVLRCRSLSSYSTNIPTEVTRQQLLNLLRRTAQPVAVVTSFLSPGNNERPYHGATLSSFTSIAMDPYPLVAFALRIPSRMATSLKAIRPEQSSYFVVNLLSADQASVAIKFSKPDLYPEPFSTVPYTLTPEGLPVLGGSLGGLSCKLVSAPLPLHDLDFLEKRDFSGRTVAEPVMAKDAVASELFIARVLRVEKQETEDAGDESPRTLPLLYHRRRYTSCQPAVPASKSH